MSEIAIRSVRAEADAPAIADLWQRVFGTASGGQTIEWLFRPGPAGACPRAVAEIDGRIVAHAGAVAQRFQLSDQVVRGGYSVAAMTDPAFRGQRLFFRVGEHLYGRMQEQGFAFVAGFSNRNSVRLMTGPMQRTPLRPFPWCVRPLWPGRATLRGATPLSAAALQSTLERRGGAGLHLTACASDDPRIDMLWTRAAPLVRVGAVRDAAYSHWRFGTRPDAHYRIVLAERGATPAALAVYRCLALRGVRAGFVVELLVADGEAAAARALLRALAQIARREGATLLSALLPRTGPARSALLRTGFVRIPEALHPQVICFSVRGLGEHAARPELVDPAAWLLSWADTDVV